MSLCLRLLIKQNKSERPVDALAVKNINHSLTDSLTTSNQEMLAHLKMIPQSPQKNYIQTRDEVIAGGAEEAEASRQSLPTLLQFHILFS